MNTGSYLSEYINDKYILKLLFLCTLFPPRGLFFPCFVFPLNLFHTRAVPSSDGSYSVVYAWWRRGPSRVYCRLPAGARGWSAHICLKPLGAGGLLLAYPRDGIFWFFLLFALITWMVPCPLIHIFQEVNLQISAKVWGGRPPALGKGRWGWRCNSSRPARPTPPCSESHPSFQKQASFPSGGFCGGNQAGALPSPAPACDWASSRLPAARRSDAICQSCAAVVCSPVLSLRACPFFLSCGKTYIT